MSKYNNNVEDTSTIQNMKTSNWDSINPEFVARMRLQNQFKTLAQFNHTSYLNPVWKGNCFSSST